jgi:hypothetical protein
MSPPRLPPVGFDWPESSPDLSANARAVDAGASEIFRNTVVLESLRYIRAGAPVWVLDMVGGTLGTIVELRVAAGDQNGLVARAGLGRDVVTLKKNLSEVVSLASHRLISSLRAKRC